MQIATWTSKTFGKIRLRVWKVIVMGRICQGKTGSVLRGYGKANRSIVGIHILHSFLGNVGKSLTSTHQLQYGTLVWQIKARCIRTGLTGRILASSHNIKISKYQHNPGCRYLIVGPIIIQSSKLLISLFSSYQLSNCPSVLRDCFWWILPSRYDSSSLDLITFRISSVVCICMHTATLILSNCAASGQGGYICINASACAAHKPSQSTFKPEWINIINILGAIYMLDQDVDAYLAMGGERIPFLEMA